MAKSTLQPFTTLQDFLFKTPLYERLLLHPENWTEAEQIWEGQFRVDGHCKYCGRETTFARGTGTSSDSGEFVRCHNGYYHLVTICARDKNHTASFMLFKSREVIFKVGQYPSLADIELSELKEYRKVLTPQDGAELHKAIGLAAHGVGIGAFVYLRRVLEHLIKRTFDENKETEGWKEEDFLLLRVTERIGFLRNHLPDFLVENKRIYSILSQGVHELSEEECLAVFAVIKAAIIEILEDEKKDKEKADRRKEIESALRNFDPGQA